MGPNRAYECLLSDQEAQHEQLKMRFPIHDLAYFCQFRRSGVAAADFPRKEISSRHRRKAGFWFGKCGSLPYLVLSTRSSRDQSQSAAGKLGNHGNIQIPQGIKLCVWVQIPVENHKFFKLVSKVSDKFAYQLRNSRWFACTIPRNSPQRWDSTETRPSFGPSARSSFRLSQSNKYSRIKIHTYR